MLGKDTGKLKSFVGADSEVTGDFVVKGILRVDGKIIGKIEADQVILTETAFMLGDILAKCIIVDGKVEGNLKATDRLEINPNGRIKGDIFTQKLLMADGAEFDGRIQMNTADLKVVDFDSTDQASSSQRA